MRQSRLVCVLLVLLFLGGCAAKTEGPRSVTYYTYFDTVCTIYSYAGESQQKFDANAAAVAALLERFHQELDIYHEYEGIQNLCTVNRAAGGAPVKISQELTDFLLYAKALYNKTGEKTNVMLGAVLTLWHSCREAALADPEQAALPTQTALEEAFLHTGIDLLEIDAENSTVRITDPKASLDVGAVGKGYAAEQAARLLSQRGCTGYVLDIGGNLRMVGAKPDGETWVTGIRDPNGDGYAATVRLSDTACVTSGAYERFFTVDGKRYHHIIDPDTLYPAEGFSSVTVITPDSALADALSTALFCMRIEEGQALAAALGNVEVMWITADGTIQTTPGLSGQWCPGS